MAPAAIVLADAAMLALESNKSNSAMFEGLGDELDVFDGLDPGDGDEAQIHFPVSSIISLS